jgi:hypothetical protein
VNPFLELAERQIAAPRKAQMRAVERRAAKTAADSALEQRDRQVEAWRTWRRERLDALLTGPHGQAAGDLHEFLSSMTLASSAELIDRVRRGPWREVDADTRFQVLSLVGAAIIELRERNAMAPFDDSLPGEEPTAFQIVREALR